MVAIVTGAGLGLERGSGWVLGSRGQLGDPSFGRFGDGATVNAATGNLVISRTDEVLTGLGLDDVVARTYNSMGLFTDDNGDNWQFSGERRIVGQASTTAGATVTRLDWDGSDTQYAYDAGRGLYVCTQGSGAYDTLSYAGNVWTWTDGGSRVVEKYDALSNGRITTSTDPDGNQIAYSYNGNLLSGVTTSNGEHTDLTWQSGTLFSLSTTRSDGSNTRVRYSNDGQGRLSTVTVDLTTDVTNDNQTVGTTYYYDGNSKRVVTILQSNGARLDIAYVGADYRVQTLTQTAASGDVRMTSFSYDTVNRVTTVTDPLNQVSKLTYDANGQLTRLELPPAAAGGAAQLSTFAYNGRGDVMSATDPNGNLTAYQYDGNGNLLQQQDQSGNIVAYTYDGNNQLISQTHYVGPEGGNSAPVAAGDSLVVVGIGDMVTFDPRINDSDPDGDVLVLSAISSAAHGTAALLNGEQIVYTRTSAGTDTFTYTVSDGRGHTQTATVTVADVTGGGNAAPTAAGDVITVGPGNTLTFDPRSNDSDPDGDRLTIASVSAAAHGTVSIVNGTQISYTRTSAGADSFTYVLSDGHAHTSPAATITVNDVPNAVPTAANDAITVVSTGDWLVFDPRPNDSDADGDLLTITAVGAGAHGTATIVNGGTAIQYQRSSAGADSFSYTISDGHGHSTTASVSVTDVLAPVMNAPIAGNAYITVIANGDALTFDPRGGAYDQEKGILTITAAGSGAAHGTAMVANGGKAITYTRTSTGSDGFYYTITDDTGLTATGYVNVYGTAPNGPNFAPTAGNDAITVVGINDTLVFDPRANDVDPDGDVLTVWLVGTAAHGNVSITNGGTRISYTRTSAGNDSFTYTVRDNNYNSYQALVSVTDTVIAPNSAPSLRNNGIGATAIGTPFVFDPRNNDSDPDGDKLTITAVGTPLHGTATTNGTSITYTRTSAGAESFSYTVSDGHNAPVTATITDEVGEAPAAANDGISIGVNNSVTFDPRANDSDPNGDALTITAVSGFTKGTATIINGGTAILYSRYAAGNDSFTYTVSDGHGHSVQALVDVTDNGIPNQTPVLADDTVSVALGATKYIDPRANDVDPDGNTLWMESATTPAHGTVSITNEGALLSYHRTSSGADSFVYRVTDLHGHIAYGTVVVLDPGENSAPVAHADYVVVPSVGNQYWVSPISNDGDIDMDTLTVTSFTTPAHGTVALQDGNILLYTRTSAGTDAFNYTISDGHGHSSTATVNVLTTAPGTNQAPVGLDDQILVANVGDSLFFNPLANDSDPDGNTLWLEQTTTPLHGNVWIDENGGMGYSRTSAGTDTFSYQFTDVHGHHAWANVTVLDGSGSSNAAPVAPNDKVVVPNVGDEYWISPLANDGDIDNDTLTITAWTNPSHGTVSLVPEGTAFHYTRTGAGIDTFTYTISDGHGHSATATITVLETYVVPNAAPNAVDDQMVVANVGDVVSFNVLANDSDFDADTLTVTAASGATHGSLAIGSGGNITYTRNSAGVDSFTYTISDAHGHGKTAIVTVNQSTLPNYAPQAVNDGIVTTTVGGSVTFDPRANDTDYNNDTLTVTAVSTPAHGSVSFTGTSITYTRASAGADSFTYTVSDNRGHSATGTVTVAAGTGVANTAPGAGADKIIVTTVGGSVTFDPRLNDTDFEGDALSIVSVSGAAHGSVSVGGGGTSITYTRTSAGVDSFTYTISDGQGHATSGTVTVANVTGVANAQPIAAGDNSYVVAVGATVTLDPRINDTDFDLDTLTVTQLSGGTHGNKSITGGGTGVSYTRTSAGIDNVTYTISDGQGHTAVNTIKFTDVTGIANQAPTAAIDKVVAAGVGTVLTFDPRINDSDFELDTLTVTAVATPAHGTVSFTGTQITYTRTTAGADSFTYTIGDGKGHSATATVSVSDTPPVTNVAPNAVADAIVVNAIGDAVRFDPRLNDADFDADALTITAASGAAHGSVAVVNGGTAIVYTRFGAGNDSFTYTISDGHGHSVTGTVSVTGAGAYNGGGTTATQPLTSRFVYDAENHLRFVIDATGAVTEYQYNSPGLRTASIAYRDNFYDIANLTPASVLTEAQLTGWAAAISDKSTVERTDVTYDPRGNVQQTKSFSVVSAAGVGQTSGPVTTVTYIYDQSGLLLSRQTTGLTYAELFHYDGLNRVTRSVDLNNAVTTIAFDDSVNNIATLTLANGMTKASVFNYAGALLTYTESTDTQGQHYYYDKLGRLRMAVNATGRRHHYLYDADGRKVADIDGLGDLTEYVYDAGNRLIRTIGYAAAVTAALVDGAGNPLAVTLDAIRPASLTGADIEYRIYDTADRLIEVIDGDGEATVFAYDGLSDLISTTRYANVLSGITGQPSALLAPATSSGDVVTRNFFDADGRQIGSLDGAGYLTKVVYNGAGEKIESIAFANATDPNQRVTGTFVQLVQSAGTNTLDSHERYFYDDRGLLRFMLDAALHPVEYVYDAVGNLTNTVDYGGTIAPPTGSYSLSYVANQASGIASTRKTWLVYDTSRKLVYTIDAAGGVIGYTYDNLGRVVKQTAYAAADTTPSTDWATLNNFATANAAGANRVSRTVYDADSRVVYTIDPLGHVTEYRYDNEDRKMLEVRYAAPYSVADGVTQQTMQQLIPAIPGDAIQTAFNYDGAGRLSETIDGENVHTAFGYDALNRLTSRTVAAGTALAVTTAYAYTAAGRLFVQTDAQGTAAEVRTRYTYDGFGRVINKTFADGTALAVITHYDYDAAGNVAFETQAYGLADATVTAYTYDAFGAVINRSSASGTADVSVTHFDHDARGLVTVLTEGYGSGSPTLTAYTRNAFGEVTDLIEAYTAPIAVTTHFAYDANGRVTAKTGAYQLAEQATTGYVYNAFGQVTDVIAAQNVAADTAITHTDYKLDGLVADVIEGYGAAGQRTSNISYDDFGRVHVQSVGVAGGTGAVTSYTYDKMGRVRTVTRSIDATSEAVTTYTYDALGNLIQAADPLNRNTFYYYDAMGRGTLIVNAANYATATLYTVRGEVSSVRRIAQVVGGTVTAGALPQLPGDNGHDEVTFYYYDALGRVTLSVDPEKYATAWTYTKLGSVSTQTRYAHQLTVSVVAGTPPVPVADPTQDATSYNYYNVFNQLFVEVDAENYATRHGINKLNETFAVLHIATRLAAPPVAGVLPTPLPTNSAVDERVVMTYDQLKRIIRVQDPSQYAQNLGETYELDTRGNRVKVTGALGGVTNKVYNKLDQLTSETIHYVWVKPDGSTEAQDVTNTYEYDANGNCTKKIEATGLPEQRTTLYSYDKLGRLTETSTDQVNVVGAANPDDLSTLSAAVPKTKYKYDADGNVIETTDPNGARTLDYYDNLGRRSAELNAAGTLSQWSYDAFGNVVSVRVYETKYTLPATAGGTPPAGAGDCRETLYAYDRDNRLLTTTATLARSGAFTGGAYVFDDSAAVSVQVITTYDFLGNVVTQTDARGGTVHYYYDRRGRKTAQVDQNQFLTTYLLDDQGNVLTERRFATRFTGTVGAAVPSIANDDVNDRVTKFTYDMNGRRRSEERLNVVVTTVSGGIASTATVSSKVQYTYNALGEVLTKQEATGDTTTYDYDKMGRQRRVIGAAFTDYTGTTNVHSITQQNYDGLNNLLSTVQNGTRITYYEYLGGRLSKMTDASGFAHYYYYDAAGHVLVDKYTRGKSDLSTVVEASTTRYDVAGRVIFQAMAQQAANGSWVFGDKTQLKYDAYGEVVARGINVLDADLGNVEKYQERFYYDKAGHVWKSTAGDGTVKLYFYDKNGNQTLAVTSDGAAWPSIATPEDAVALLAGGHPPTIGAGAAGLVLTMTVYDARGQAVQTYEPSRQLGGNATSGYVTANITHSRVYNAFGEVIQEVDPRDATYVTDYTYNTLGKVIKRELPAVNFTNEAGGVDSRRPTETYYYDASGRLVGVRDANQNFAHPNDTLFIATRDLLAGSGYGGADAVVVKEYHPDGGVIINGYDAFGDLRKTTNEMGKVETYGYDAMGRRTSQTHAARADGSALTDTYGYDGLGHVLSHANNMAGSGVNTTDYDLQGRVINTVDMGGHATSYSYTWNGDMAATGFGTFGGWRRQTVNAAGKVAKEDDDIFGHLVWKQDYGNHSFAYTFDAAGRVIKQVSSEKVFDSQRVDYSYYNTGLMASAFDGFVDANWLGMPFNSGVTTTFAYDAAGNRTFEGMVSTFQTSAPDAPISDAASVTLQNAVTIYDADGRMTYLNDTRQGAFVVYDGTVNTQNAPITVRWEYDLNGNIRRAHTTYSAINDHGTVTTTGADQDYWYKYDNMNRFVLTKGTMSGVTIGVGAAGSAISYNADGSRATMIDASGTETYSYTYDGYLAQVMIGPQVRAVYTYDLMGRVTSQAEYAAGDAVNPVFNHHDIIYNAGSQMVSDIQDTKRSDNSTWKTTSQYYYTDVVTGAYDGGAVTRVMAQVLRNGAAQPSTETKNLFAWWDGAVQSETDFNADTSLSAVLKNYYVYDEKGHLSYVSVDDGHQRTVSFTNNLAGQAIQRDEHPSADPAKAVPHELRYFFNGIQIGVVSNNGTSDVDYAASITQQTQAPPGTPGWFRGGQNYNPSMSVADFDQSYSPINGSSVGATAGSYAVQAGETLQSIALAVWGDAALWYLIADANGLSGASSLSAGQTIQLPNKVANVHNNASTFKVYDPNDVIGDVSPTVPKPKKQQGCGAFGQILLVIIAVIVTILLKVPVTNLIAFGSVSGAGTAASTAALAAGASASGAAAAAAASAGFGATVAGGFIAGAAGSIVSQGVGLATGIQSKFDWGAVAMAGIGGGVGAGLGNVITGTGIGFDVLRGVLGNAITQGIGVATGLQKKFDWAGVAAAGIGAGVSSYVAGQLDSWTPFGANGGLMNLGAQMLVSGVAGDIANAATRTLINGSDFGDNLIAALPDTIGNTIGTLVAMQVQGPSMEASHPSDIQTMDETMTKPDPTPLASGALESGGDGGRAGANEIQSAYFAEFGGGPSTPDKPLVELAQVDPTGMTPTSGITADDMINAFTPPESEWRHFFDADLPNDSPMRFLVETGIIPRDASMVDFYNKYFDINSMKLSDRAAYAQSHGTTDVEMHVALELVNNDYSFRASETFAAILRSPSLRGEFKDNEADLHKYLEESGIKKKYVNAMYNNMLDIGHLNEWVPLAQATRWNTYKAFVGGGSILLNILSLGGGPELKVEQEAFVAARPFVDVWRMNPIKRGNYLEKIFGAGDLPHNYPVIDKMQFGVATSIKSVDLSLPAYQSESGLASLLKGFADKASKFNGRKWGTANILASDIKGRAVELIIPNGGTAAQQRVIADFVKYSAGLKNKVNVIIHHYP